MCFKKLFQSHLFSHLLSLPSEAQSSPRRSGRILVRMGPRVPDARFTPHLFSGKLQILEEVFCHLGYYSVIHLP